MNKNNDGEPYRVADVNITFKNTSEIVQILRQRGMAIQRGDNKQMAKLDKKLNKYVKANKDTLREPIEAFITCEERKGW